MHGQRENSIPTTNKVCWGYNETRGSFATILDSKCGLIDWLAFCLMRRLELVDHESGWGTVFCCYLRSLHNSLVMESGCSCNDGAGKQFWGIKNLSSCCFLVANFLVILSVNANANMLSASR